MTIDPTSFVPGMNSGAAPVRQPKQDMDSEMFMSLLVAQLSNQDPSSPMDTTDMMSQQTQLAQMEKLTELAKVGQEQFALTMRMAAADLVGREVAYTNAAGEVVTGAAESASFAHEVPFISVGGTEVQLDHILSILPNGQVTNPAPNPGNDPDTDD